MKERPILFSAAMVNAIRAGRKTQTRRVVIPQPEGATSAAMLEECVHMHIPYRAGFYVWPKSVGTVPCPYGTPGDRLWVREAFRYWFEEDGLWDCIDYSAGGQPMKPEGLDFDTGMRFSERCARDSKFRPSIHMPRWASRITLEVTRVRVERVQDIGVTDIEAEGVYCGVPWDGCGQWKKAMYAKWVALWDSINAARGFGIDKNPWVWVVEFKRVEGGAG
jgi:hypothetical protein